MNLKRIAFLGIVISFCLIQCLKSEKAAHPDKDATEQSVSGINETVMAKLGWKIAVQCWTYNNLTLFEALDNIQALGVHYVELLSRQTVADDVPATIGPDMDANSMSRVKTKLKETGIQAIAVWVDPFPKDETSVRKLFVWAKELGIEVITTEVDPEDRVALAMAAALCREFQIRIAVHNHPKPTTYWNPEFALNVVKDFHPWIGLCPDTGHWYRSELATMECLKKIAGHVVSIHYKDVNVDKKDVPFGTGVNHAADQLAELKRQEFKGVITIEYENWGAQQHSELVQCVAFLNQTAAQLAP